MNEMDPEPAWSSRPRSEAKVEKEKAVPMTRNTKQNTAATTRGPEVVDNQVGLVSITLAKRTIASGKTFAARDKERLLYLLRLGCLPPCLWCPPRSPPPGVSRPRAISPGHHYRSVSTGPASFPADSRSVA
jgi:hypothetical protein